MSKGKLEKEEDAVAQAFNVTPAGEQEIVVRDADAQLKAATAETVVGVAETGDEQLVADFVVWLQSKAEEANADSMAMLAQALRKADNATNIAEALKETPAISSKNVIDRPFVCYGYTIHEGEYEDSDLPFFASFDVRFKEIPEPVVINTGAFKVLALLPAFDRINAWPIPLVFYGKKTRKGHQVLGLKYLGDENPTE